MTHYAITMTDGSVAIMQTFPQVIAGNTFDPDPLAEIAKWHLDEQAKVVSVAEIDPAVIPQDRAFRNAWMLSGDKIEHDMDKAREIKRDQLRALRKPLMEALDIDQKRALVVEDKAEVAAIEAVLQSLRDVTIDPAIESAKTPEELNAIIPEALMEKPK